jgi:hypothetical protein
MDLPAVQCLNEEVPNSGRAILKLHEDRLSQTPVLRSQPDDPELLLHIPFTENVTIQSIAIRSVVDMNNNNNNMNDNDNDNPACPPKTIKLFVNREDLDFETARELEPQAKLELLPPHHFVEGTIDYPLRPAGRFQSVSSLTIFVADNHDEDDDEVSTIITFVGLKGKGTKQRRMAVETVYESQGMMKDHKVKGEHGNMQFM